MEPATPKFGDKVEKWKPAAFGAISDHLEVNPQELDEKFDSWLPFASEDVSLQSSAPSTSFVCDGLSRALHDLWLRLCEVSAAALGDDKLRLEASGRRPAVAAERAVEALLRGQETNARECLENFLGEYLLRILRRLEVWLERYDPSADEVAVVAKWMLFQAEPALLPFCQRAESFAGDGPLQHCQQAVLSIEKLLLREWESRSCEEASALCSYVFEGHYTDEAGRVDLTRLLKSLQESGDAWQTWRSHGAACNRAASVLIAMLNAALRSQHAASRNLILETAKLKRRRRSTFPKMIQMGRQALQDLQKVGACSDGKANKISEELLVHAAEDAVQLAVFCSRAGDSLEGWGPAQEVCREVLHAMEASFQTQVSSLTNALTTTHYHYNHHLLKVESFNSLRSRKNGSGDGILSSATAGWMEFLHGFKAKNASKMLQERVGGSIVELLAFAWVQNFVRAPPPLSVWKDRLYLVFSADEANLTSLAPDSRELGQFREVLQTLRDFLQANAQSRWQQLGKAESVLQKLLTDEQGRALTHALWQTATH
eukprot:symbB.v1.2.023830.t1/scaffold2214.1/size85597/5